MQNETTYKEPECWNKLAELRGEIEKLREIIAPVIVMRPKNDAKLATVSGSPLLDKIEELTRLVAEITSDIRI